MKFDIIVLIYFYNLGIAIFTVWLGDLIVVTVSCVVSLWHVKFEES